MEAVETSNRYVRATTDEFWNAQATRTMDRESMPHYAYMPTPLDPDRVVSPVHANIPDEMGPMPDNIRAIHDTQQAIMAHRREMESQTRLRNLRRFQR